MGEDSITVIPDLESASVPTDADSLSVLVLSSSFIATYPLPDGEVTVGRSQSVEIYVDDPVVSRRHAILTGSPPAIRDLGSSNGTRVLGDKLAPGERRALAVGDVITMGSTTLLIQRGGTPVRPRRFWTREHFEERLREETARAERGNDGFAVACLHLERSVPDVGVRRVLARALRATDVVGELGSGGYAILLIDADRDQSRAVLDRIATELAQHAVASRWGIAEFPGDGRTPVELIAHAQRVADGGRRAPSVSDATASDEGRIVADPVTREVFQIAARIAAGDISVLIVGETGVGKEVMAEEIHRRSPRSKQPLLRLNCAALSESLLESELFGHERGAFTSANMAKPGLLETAEGGTVLLDELGEMPLSLQAKLLRVIEDKQVRRVGGVKSRPLDVRFIAATNRDLKEHAARGLFRLDLYYRLAGVTIAIPPLRDRPADVAPLVRVYLEQASRHLGGPPAKVSDEALAELTSYAWPGNIRELRHVIERAVLLAGNGVITPAHLALDRSAEPVRTIRLTAPGAEPSSGIAAPAPAVAPGSSPSIPVPVPAPAGADDDPERQRILDALAACGGNQSRAARKLGMSRGALIRRLVHYGITRPHGPD